MKERATIYDFARMCGKYAILDCSHCPLSYDNNGWEQGCNDFVKTFPDQANEIILKWCKEHPVKTRQYKFLEMFPNASINGIGALVVCPDNIDKTYKVVCDNIDCSRCHKEYWLAEVEENENKRI